MDKKLILSFYREIPYSDLLFNKETLNLKELLYTKESQKPENLEFPDKIKQSDKIYRDDFWRKNQVTKNEGVETDKTNGKNNSEFNRGSNFVNKENNGQSGQGHKVISLEIKNLNLSKTPLQISPEDPFYYIKGQYPNYTGPFSANQLEEMYKNNKLDSNFSFRPIDFFCFKGTKFMFKSIKIINNEKWYETLVMNEMINEEEYLKSFEKETKKNDNNMIK